MDYTDNVDYHFIPHVALSEQKLARLLQIMKEGNDVLRRHSDAILGKRKRKDFRARVFKGDFKEKIPTQDLDKIFKVKNECELPILSGYAPLVSGQAKYWSFRIADYLDRDNILFDLTQEGNMALIDSVYGYTGSVEFITYVWTNVSRRLKRVVEGLRYPLLPPSKDGALELVRQYERFLQDSQTPMTFDAYTSQVGYSPEEERTLARAIVRVINSSDISTMDQGDDNLDYTQFGKLDVAVEPGYDQFIVCPKCNHRELIDVEEVNTCPVCKHEGMEVCRSDVHALLMQCIDAANLSPFQKDLLIGSVDGEHGWKKQIADKHGRTRQATAYAFARATELVKNAFKEFGFEE